jgi:hypothetical protein
MGGDRPDSVVSSELRAGAEFNMGVVPLFSTWTAKCESQHFQCLLRLYDRYEETGRHQKELKGWHSMASGGSGRGNANAKLLATLASGATWQEAAQETGLSQRTIARRLKDPKFKAALDRRKDAILAAVVSKLVNSSTKAVATLQELLDCDSHSARLGAARSILELSASMRTSHEQTERICQLEERLNVQSQ